MGGGGGEEGVEKSLGLRIVFTLCTPSTHTRTLKMDAQHNKRQKIIEQITKTCQTSRDNINIPLETVKTPYRFNSSFFKGTTFYDVFNKIINLIPGAAPAYTYFNMIDTNYFIKSK